MFLKKRLCCTTLTPVHIGTGEAIEPFNYHIKNNILYFLNVSKFLSEAEKRLRTELLEIIETNDILRLRKFIRTRVDVDKYSLFQIKVMPEIAEEYEVKKDDMKNQLLINPFMRNPLKNNPYIPGSAFKGAIRTAVLNYFLKKQNLGQIRAQIQKERPIRAAQKVEKLILKHRAPDDDPFRAIKISDADLPKDATFVAEVFNYNPKRNRFNSMDIRVEMTEGQFLNQEIEFELDITLLPEAKVSLSLNMDAIKQACQQFYKNIALYEHEKFYKHQPDLREISIRLLNVIETLPENSFIIRLGRFSHAESMTLEGLRRISVMGKGRKVYLQEEGTTRNLALKKYPMGWVKVEIKC